MPRRHAPSTAADLADSLLRLGLTHAESEVYTFLLSESPATGYRIAQAIGRPVGNVYKAVEALEAKGAALVADDDDHRVARAVPLSEFATQVRHRVARACADAEAAAASYSMATPSADDFDDRLYRISNIDQFDACARALLSGAGSFVLAMGAPIAIDRVAELLVSTAARGIPVAIKSLVPIDLPGVRVVLDARGEAALFNAPGHWLTINADGGQLLDVILDADIGDVLTGYATHNPLLAWTSYTGLYSRLVLEELRSAGRLDAASASRGESWAPFENSYSLGKRLMVERFRSPSPGARRSPRRKKEGGDG